MSDVLVTVLNAKVHVLGADVLWREIVGNVFGLASAVYGMRRKVAAWPVGLVGNAILVTVFLGGVFHTPQDKDLWGQAGRQVMFAVIGIYGWWRWRQNKRADSTPEPAVQPRQASWTERGLLVVAAGVGVLVLRPILEALNSFGPWSDAWILTGSLLATYGMARGWVEFWIIWIGVDAVGVPLLLRAHYYPSALMYLIYGAFCIVGFARWLFLSLDRSGIRPDSPAVEVVA